MVTRISLAVGLTTPIWLATSAGLAWPHGIATQPESLTTSVRDVQTLGD